MQKHRTNGHGHFFLERWIVGLFNSTEKTFQVLGTGPSAKAILLPFAGILLLLLAGHTMPGMARHVVQTLPLVAMVFIYVKKFSNKINGLHVMRPSLPMVGISVAAFIIAMQVSGAWQGIAVWTGVLTGLFCTIRFSELERNIAHNVRMTRIALIAVLSGPAFFWLQPLAWKTFSNATTTIMSFILRPWVDNLSVAENGVVAGKPALVAYPHAHHVVNVIRHAMHLRRPLHPVPPPVPHPPAIEWHVMEQYRDFMALMSDHFVMKFYASATVMNGMFLFIFLLSVMLVLDWKTFEQRRLGVIYLFGLAYIFLANVMMMTFIYAIGSWSMNIQASAFARSFRGWPAFLSEGCTGFIGYLIAFAVFMFLIYRSPRRSGTYR